MKIDDCEQESSPLDIIGQDEMNSVAEKIYANKSQQCPVKFLQFE